VVLAPRFGLVELPSFLIFVSTLAILLVFLFLGSHLALLEVGLVVEVLSWERERPPAPSLPALRRARSPSVTLVGRGLGRLEGSLQVRRRVGRVCLT